MATIDAQQAHDFLTALGNDLHWRLIKADDRNHLRNEDGHWLENPGDKGRPAGDLPLERLDDQFSWHVRPMPLTGPYVLTMLDDANRQTLDRMTSEGLPPTAAIQTSEGRYQVWHRWPWAMPREKTRQLLTHLQKHYGTDSGANMVGHNGRLPGTRNWKRDPAKGIDRAGCETFTVVCNPALTRPQATDWITRNPVPQLELQPPAPITIPSGMVGAFDFDDPRYQRMLAKSLPLLPQLWAQAYDRNGDGNRADAAVATRAVVLMLDDSAITGILDPLIRSSGREAKAQRPDYIPRTIAHARDFTGVISPGVWTSKFDAARHFPWMKEQSKVAER